MKMVSLGEIATINPPAPKAAVFETGELVDFVPMADVLSDGRMRAREQRRYEDVRKGYTAFANNDLLIAKVTPCFENNKIAIATLNTEHGFGSTEFHVVRGDRDALDQRYLLHFMRQDWIRKEGERRMTGSGGQRRVPATFLRDLSVFLPQLAEQKRIATVLDQADDFRRKAAAQSHRMRQLHDAIFWSMFTKSSQAPLMPLGDVISMSSGAGLTGKMQKGGSIPVYGGNGITGWHDVANVGADTVVIGRVGVYCGAVHRTDRPAWVTDNALIATPKINVSSCYLEDALRHARLNQYANTSSQPLVSAGRLKSVQVVIPSLASQSSYESAAAVIERGKSVANAACVKSDALFKSLQHRAFRGGL